MYVIMDQRGRYFAPHATWTKDKAKAFRFEQYVVACMYRPRGGRVIEV